MNERERTRRSKFLSLVLRHQPETIGLVLDEAGWVAIDTLLAQMAAHGKSTSRETLEELVRASSKQRFAISDDGLRIRANQGHSVFVQLGLAAAKPPARLFHGTVAAALQAIQAEGLSKMNRHHVHLSADSATATMVGQRRGKAIVLGVEAGRMSEAGFVFYRSENGVWLTEAVPRQFLVMPGSS